MKNPNKGFIVPLLIAIIAILAIGGGVYAYHEKKIADMAVSENMAMNASTTTDANFTDNTSINGNVSTNPSYTNTTTYVPPAAHTTVSSTTTVKVSNPITTISPTVTIPSDWKPYSNSQLGFSLSYPPSYGTPTTQILGSSNETNFGGQLYVENRINYNNGTGKSFTLEEFVGSPSTDPTVTYKKQNITIDGNPAIQISECHTGGMMGGVCDLSAYTIKNNSIFTITQHADLNNTSEVTVFNQVVSSFKFLNATTVSASPYITLVSPNGGEVLKAGQTYTIKWNSSETTGTVSLDLLSGGHDRGIINYGEKTPVTAGQYTWTVPGPYATDGNETNDVLYIYNFKGTAGETTATALSDKSDGTFTITQ